MGRSVIANQNRPWSASGRHPNEGTALVALLLVLSGCGPSSPPPSRPETGRVASVADGDTLRLVDGRRVRLVGIDAPERGEECYGDAARTVLVALLPVGTEIVLEREPSLDDHDRFDRLLRTVFAGGRNVNLTLVERGAAAPYFYRGDRGRGSAALLRAAERARAARRGLWGSCPAARLRPTRALDSGAS